MERIRAFVALSLPVGAIDKVAVLQRELREASQGVGARVAWVPPPNMHATLKFLGEIPAESAYALRDELGERLAARRSWKLDVRGVGVFPSSERPRVLWIGLHDEEEQLRRLAADVDAWLNELGFAPERRPFHPHLTLGRIKQGATKSGSEQFWAEWKERQVAHCSPTEVVLYRSVLQQQGVEYSALARFELSRPPKSR